MDLFGPLKFTFVIFKRRPATTRVSHTTWAHALLLKLAPIFQCNEILLIKCTVEIHLTLDIDSFLLPFIDGSRAVVV